MHERYNEINCIDVFRFLIDKKRKFASIVATKNSRGILLAFRDQGSCIQVGPLQVSYYYCEETVKMLAKFPQTLYSEQVKLAWFGGINFE